LGGADTERREELSKSKGVIFEKGFAGRRTVLGRDVENVGGVVKQDGGIRDLSGKKMRGTRGM